MRRIFENILAPINIGKARLSNSIYKPAAGTKLFKDSDGYVTEKGKLIYEAWARGGVGAVVVESPAIGDELSVDIPGKYRIDDDKYIPGLADLAKGILKNDSIAILQLYHAGQWHLRDLSGLNPVSASAHAPISEFASVGDLSLLKDLPPCEELSVEKIEIIEQQFIDAAERAAKAGFQAVDVNAGANHLLGSFISRYWNSRQDKYGCTSYENRARIVVNIIRGIKKRLGDDFPIMVTMNGHENGMGDLGQTVDEACSIANLFVEAGADAFQIRVYEIYNRACYWTEQYFFPEQRDPLPENMDFSHKGVGAFNLVTGDIKKKVSKPIMAPGKWDFDLPFADKLIKQKKVDILGLVRALFADPELPNKLREGRIEDIAPCTACLTCLTGGMFPIKCRINKFLGGDKKYNVYPKLSKKKKVLIAGAGPAGLEAARVSALRGHDVTLYSKETYLGGLMNMANVVKGSYPENVNNIKKYYEAQLTKLKVRVVTGREVDLKLIEQEKPDAVVLATGALLSDRQLPGSDSKIVVSDTFLRNAMNLAFKVISPPMVSKATSLWMPLGKSVIVMGGDIKGVQLAEFLIKRNREVTLVSEEGGEQYGEGLPNMVKFKIGEWFKAKPVKTFFNVRYDEITKTGLVITTEDGQTEKLRADSIVTVFPLRKDEDLYASLQGKVDEVYTIGACRDPKALIVDAIDHASEIASAL